MEKIHGDSLEIHDPTFIKEARRQSILSAEADLKSDIFDFIDAIQYFGDDA
ncbi:MAG: DUF3018 domain-containing protein [Alphaproteobacteria bacterium]|nr:DUF3018 domain-containing protein [Alphaproteobacteria bacterium]